MSYMIRNKKRKQTLESAQYGLEISFKFLLPRVFAHEPEEALIVPPRIKKSNNILIEGGINPDLKKLGAHCGPV